MERVRRALAAIGVVLITGGLLLGTRPMTRRVDRIGFRCGTYLRPRCHTYEWPSVVAVALTSGGVALVASMAVCWFTVRRARSRTRLDSLAPAEGLSTLQALLLVAVPIFVAGTVAGAVFFNLVVTNVPAGD